jgi:hypothetical protein
MKARDIIPGWPRGRSTWAHAPSRWDLEGFDFGQNRLAWRDRVRKCSDLKVDVIYHEAQQRMVNAYFERWRIGQVVRRDEQQEFFAGMFARHLAMIQVEIDLPEGVHVVNYPWVGTRDAVSPEPKSIDPTSIGTCPPPERQGP